MDKLKSCLSSHECDPRRPATSLPKRLVDLSSITTGGPPRLIDTANAINGNEAPEYVCLSHCWGKLHVTRTTTESIQQHMEAIPHETLSKTFQHSIEIALKFNVRFIWIDSLCIIQDNILDWQEQGSCMADIYENCLFVIAATASADGSGGCFKRVPSEISTPSEASRSSECGRTFAVRARKSVQHPDVLIHAPDGYKIEAPLIDRAWVFQEGSLGPRILHFTASELIWECKHDLSCQCGRVKARRYMSKPGPFYSLSTDDDERLFFEWHKTVEAYSQRKLTYESDRLPALSGIAKRMQKQVSPACAASNRYLAGIWERDLLSGLTWRCIGVTQERDSGQTHYIPTWSWASVPGPVVYPTRGELDPNQPTARVVQAECTLAGLDPTGAVAGGKLTIAGPLIEVTLEYDPTENPSPHEIGYYITRKTANDNRPSIEPDHLFSEPGEFHIDPGEIIFCLWLGSMRLEKFGTEEPAGARLSPEYFLTLLLRSSRAMDNAFERIGFFESSEVHSAQGWFDGVPETEVTLV